MNELCLCCWKLDSFDVCKQASVSCVYVCVLRKQMLFLSSLSVYYKTEHMGVISVAIDSSVCMTSSHRKEDDDVVLVESELLNGMVWFFFVIMRV